MNPIMLPLACPRGGISICQQLPLSTRNAGVEAFRRSPVSLADYLDQSSPGLLPVCVNPHASY